MKNSNPSTELDIARKSIMMGETSKAFSILFDCIHHLKDETGKKLHNELCIHSHNFSQLEKNRRLGTISNEIMMQHSNKITLSIIETITALEKHIDAEGLSVKKIDINNSFNIPRSLIPDRFYYGFIITGVSLGMVLGVIFMALYYDYLVKNKNNLKELLYIASIGVGTSLFLFGAFDGLNRQKSMLVDLRIVLPHVVLIILLLVFSGILTLNLGN